MIPHLVVALLAAQVDGGPDTSTRFETMVSAAGERQGTTLRDARMQEVGARTAVEALDYDPNVAPTTGQRGERIITLRGFAQTQLAVLLDGAPFSIPYDGQIDLDMVPAAMIERIDVAPGASSVLAGPGGLGGVVDLRTRRAGKGPLLFTQLEAGGLGRFEVNARASAKRGPFGVTLFSGFQKRDATPVPQAFVANSKEDGGARLNSDRSVGFIGIAASAQTGRHSFELTGWYLTGERGMPPSTTDDRPRFWRFGLWNAATVQVGHRYENDGMKIETMAWYRSAINRVDAYDSNAFDTQRTARAFSSLYDDASGGVRTRGSGHILENLLWRFWVGAQLEEHHSSANNAPDDDVSRVIVTGAPELEWKPFQRLTLLAGLQFDVEVPVKLPGSQLGLGPGPMLSAVFTAHPTLTFTLTGARRTRFPTLKERFSEALGFRITNPSLRPESAWHVGLTGSWKPVEGLQIDASGWNAEVNDLITEVRVAGGLAQLQNIASARLAGGELAISWRFRGLLRTRAGYVGQSTWRLSAPVGLLEYRPQHQGVLDVAVTPFPWLELWAGVRVMSERVFTNPDDARQLLTLPGNAVVDARIEGGPAFARVWVRATNLFDTLTTTEVGFPMPGRQILVGVSLQVD